MDVETSMTGWTSRVATEAPSIQADTEAQLVSRAASDPDAFAALYQRHRDAIARYIQRRVGDTNLTDDLVSETFFTALRYIGRYRHRGLPFRSWLYRLATTAVTRWARREGRVRFRPIVDDPAVEARSDDRGEVARGALMALPAPLQDVLVLHSIEGLPVVEVAKIVGCREGTVKSRLSRARAAMRDELSKRRWRS